MAGQNHRIGYRPQAPTPGSVTPARTTIAPGVYQGKQQMLADALMQSRNAAQQGPQDIGAQVGQALNTIGTSYMAGANERAGQAERAVANKIAANALAAGLRGDPLGQEAIDAIGNEWIDPGYQQVIAQMIAEQTKPDALDLVEIANPDGSKRLVKKSEAVGQLAEIAPLGKAPESRKITRGGMEVTQEWNPATNAWTDVAEGPRFKDQGSGIEIDTNGDGIPDISIGGGGVGGKPTESNAQALFRGTLLGQAMDEIQAVADSGFANISPGRMATAEFAGQYGPLGRFAGEKLKSDEEKKYQAAVAKGTESLVAAITGAGVAVEQFPRIQQNIPLPTDNPDMVRYKLQQLQNELRALKISAGPLAPALTQGQNAGGAPDGGNIIRYDATGKRIP